MSDNATNFKGAAAELNRFIKLICNKNKTLANYFASEAIQWKFIPPRSPNFGVCGRQGVAVYNKVCTNYLETLENDYLNHLPQRNKWQFEKNNVAVGCLVLLKENDLPPYKWAMARILEVIYGTDGATETSRNITVRVIERDTSGEIYYVLEDSRGFRTRQNERKCEAQRRLDTFVVLYPKRYPPAIRLRTNVTRRAALPGKPEFRLRGKYGCKAGT
ncbi:DUF5641 domain-containing protein [Trichonephila clavipes]|uniref:DUF5641 domain-containing protein n=1 Tax=Trichonephila clavipes TaxID=2585209 RepID=A0A8X6VC44_TRICX|nr:DUF5641 domain-containing protein [Trichonephila clavipes]